MVREIVSVNVFRVLLQTWANHQSCTILFVPVSLQFKSLLIFLQLTMLIYLTTLIIQVVVCGSEAWTLKSLTLQDESMEDQLRKPKNGGLHVYMSICVLLALFLPYSSQGWQVSPELSDQSAHTHFLYSISRPSPPLLLLSYRRLFVPVWRKLQDIVSVIKV